MFTCALIDQHPIFHLGLQIFLEQHFHKINFYPTRDLDGFSNLPNHQTIDMIILGLNDESKFNWQLIELCNLRHPGAILVVHAEIVDSETVLRLLELGVKGVVLKGNDPADILDCIKKNQQGHIYMSPELEKIVFNKMITDNSQNKLSRQDRGGLSSLTVRQYMMATLLIKGMKTSEIAEALMVAPSTVSTVKATILKKTKAANIVELITILKQQKS